MAEAAATLKGKTLFITGASRGVGKAIGLRAARDGANVVIAAKTTRAHPKLPGTIFTAAEEIEAAGGKALPVKCDIRFEDQIQAAMDAAGEHFGGIDILVNNASAISLTNTQDTTLRYFDRMMSVNARGSYACSKLALPQLLNADNPHILNICPPMNLDPRWFKDFAAYTFSKYAMSAWVLGMSAELAGQGVAVNGLWPKTTVATAAIRNLLGGEPMVRRSREPAIVGDAARAILVRSSRSCTGNLYLDEEVLAEEGVTDLSGYAIDPAAELQIDLFLDDAQPLS